MERWLVVLVSVKLLLIPAYVSTDFEVHRHWMALTHSLPVSEWYKNEASEWTLDYPPLFAWLEWGLSHLAALADPQMVVVANTGYTSPQTTTFLRLSVVACDLVFFACVRWYFARRPEPLGKPDVLAALLACADGGLALIDSVHFQYNSIVLAVVIASFVALGNDRVLAASVLFTCAVNLKHVVVCMGPVFAVHILSRYCCQPPALATRFVARLGGVGCAVVGVFAVSFGPWAALGQVPLVLSRMFAFGRGLCHAYWAANVWALYNVADLGASVVLGGRGGESSTTRGLVGTTSHAVLPSVSPAVSAAFVLAAMTPLLVRVWRHPKPSLFPLFASVGAMCYFMFGWHIHEKHALLSTIPLGLVLGHDQQIDEIALLLNLVAGVSFFPLFEGREEWLPKVLLVGVPFLLATHRLVVRWPHRPRWTTVRMVGVVTVLGLVEMFRVVAYPLVIAPKLPFLPLLLMSSACAALNLALFVWLYARCLTIC